MEAESGPARAASLLAGLGFSEADEDRGWGVGEGGASAADGGEWKGEGGIEGTRRRGESRRGELSEGKRRAGNEGRRRARDEGGGEGDAPATREGDALATTEAGRGEGRETLLNSRSFVYT